MTHFNDQIHENLIAHGYKHTHHEAESDGREIDNKPGERWRSPFDEYLRPDSYVIIGKRERVDPFELPNTIEERRVSTAPSPLVISLCLIGACAAGYLFQGWGGM